MKEPHEGPDVPDELFARVAVGRRFATLGALGECLQTVRREGGAGRGTLSATMLRQGVLTRDDVETILAIARAGELDLRCVEDFAIITKIGEGGMGAVYAAMDVESCELCAVKVLPADLAEDEDLVRRFEREAEVAVGLDHPNIVCGIRTGETEGLHYFAMDFVDGETVYERVEREGTIPEGETLRIVRGTCLGLQYASERGLVHRDIKPENIMVARDGTPRLLDLGLVKTEDAGRVSRLTRDGMAIGTPHYISPEQARGEHDVDARSDIYALGGTAYHMLTGTVPFEGPTAAVIMTKHLTEVLDWPSDVNPEISEHASRLVSKMMAKEPHDRYQRPKDVVADIDLIMSGRAPSGELLPPGASSIRSAVKISRAIEKAARWRRERTESGTTAVYERVRKRRGVPLVQVFERHRKIMIPVAGVLFVLALVVLAIALGGGEEPKRGPPDVAPSAAQTGPAPGAAVRPSRAAGSELLARRLEELVNANVERIPELVDALSDLADLTPGQARLVFAAKRAARERLDAEAERRLKDILSREERGLIDRAKALSELTSLQATFARSVVLPRIVKSIAEHAAPARPSAPEIRGVPLAEAEGFEGWKVYGEWRLGRSEGEGEIVFRFDPKRRYSHALQSPFGFGECRLTAEVYTEGGERGEIALWEQATEDGAKGEDRDSAVRVTLGEADVKSAEKRWARFEIAAGPEGVRASLARRALRCERTGTLSHGRLTFSFVGGLWRVRAVELLPALADGEVVYEVGFEDGESHGWSGRIGEKSLAAARGVPGEWGVWAYVGAKGEAGDVRNWETLFEVAGGQRLAFAFRAERVPELRARVIAGGPASRPTVYELRLSGRPPQGRWTALTVPLADFRSVETGDKRGDPPPLGARVTGLWIGAPAAQPELLISLVRVVR